MGLGGVLAGAPRVAEACSPSCPATMLPKNRSSVPANTKIWVFDGWIVKNIVSNQFAEVCGGDSEPHLETEDGQPVPWTLQRFGDAIAFTPDELLTVGSRYVVRIACPGDGLQDVTFEVAAPADTEAPGAPSMQLGGVVQETDDCWDQTYREVGVSGGAPLYLIDVRPASASDWALASGLGGGVTNSLSKLGRAACGRGHWGNVEGPASVRIAAMDLAGNRSEWTEPVEVTFEAPEKSAGKVARRLLDCACTTGAPKPPSPWWIALLAVVRRRRAAEADARNTSPSCAASRS